jgi:hypothetical protein
VNALCSTPLVLGESKVINVVLHLTVTVKALCSTPLVLGESTVINVVLYLTVTVKALGVEHKSFTVTVR